MKVWVLMVDEAMGADTSCNVFAFASEESAKRKMETLYMRALNKFCSRSLCGNIITSKYNMYCDIFEEFNYPENHSAFEIKEVEVEQ